MAFEEPGSAVPPLLAWTAFFFLAFCGVYAQTGFDLAFLVAAGAAGLAAIGWTVWHAFGWHGGMSGAAHRCVMGVALLVVAISLPFSSRLRVDAEDLWAQEQGHATLPIRSAADLESRKLRPESLLEFSGRARCEVTDDEQGNPDVDCRRLRWDGNVMPALASEPDALTLALLQLRTLSGTGPEQRVKRPRGGWMVDPSHQLPHPAQTLDILVQACGEAEPSPDADAEDGCTLVKRAVKSGLWGLAADKHMLDLTSWSGWLAQREALSEAFMRNAVPWQNAVDTLVKDRETKRLSALGAEIRQAQRGGVLLVLTRPPASSNAFRWPTWQSDRNNANNEVDGAASSTINGAINKAVDKLLALTRPTGLEPFEFRGRFVRRAAVPGETPEYWLDADRPPLTLEQSRRTLLLIACAVALFLLHGLALLVVELWTMAAVLLRRWRAK